MARHSYIRVRKLKDASGFVDYISNESRQEHLLGRFEMIDRAYRQSKPDGNYWKDLGQYNRLAYMKSPNYTEGTDVVEAREVVVALPEDFYHMYKGRYDDLAKELGRFFSEQYKVSSLSCAVHLSEKEGDDFRNMHIHLVFSERDYKGPVDNIARRNVWRDQFGASISKTKALELGEGNYTFIPKGTEDPFVEGEWNAKNPYLKTLEFTKKLKIDLTDRINQIGKSHHSNYEPLQVFDQDGLYLPQTKIGHADEFIRRNLEESNRIARAHNELVDEAIFKTAGDLQKDFVLEAKTVVREFKKAKRTHLGFQEFKKVWERSGYTFKVEMWIEPYQKAAARLENWIQKNIPWLQERLEGDRGDISQLDR